jgi:D-amino-acid dehydrogenase
VAESRKNVLIIGGGVIGLCSAYYVMQKGHRVTLLERGEPEHDSCSLGNAGMVVPSHCIPLAAPGMVWLGLRMMWNPASPFYIKPRFRPSLWNWVWKFIRASTWSRVEKAAPLLRDLSLASRQCFVELSGIPGNEFGLTQKGLLMLCKTSRALKEESHGAARARELGIPAEVLTPEQTARLDPDIRMEIAGSVYYPKDCHLSPNRFMSGLTRILEQGGTTFAWRTEVTGWRIRGERVESVQTNRGGWNADEFVVAGGAWSPLMTRELGLKLPMEAGKGYSLTLTRPPQIPGLCSILTEARVAVTPMGKSLRVGGTMEFAGLDESVNPVRVRGIIRSIPKYFPQFGEDDFKSIPVWRGLRPCTPDGLPYVGRSRQFSNLCLATGHAMMGLSLGPITGKLTANILADQPPGLDIELLDPERYE